MWTRFLPHVYALHQVIDAGEIGEIINLSADHGQAFTFDPKSRLFDPALAGGALLDLGVYPVSFAHDFLGVPDAVQAVGQLTPTGVDGQISIVLSYGDRAQATLSTTLWAKTPTIAHDLRHRGQHRVKGSFYGTDVVPRAASRRPRLGRSTSPAPRACSTRPRRSPAGSPRARRRARA